MQTPAELRRIVQRLGVEVREPSLFATSAAGLPLEPIRDPILRELAEKPDWREYESMWQLPEVYDPWRHMTASVLAEPFEVQPASNRPAAKVLAEQARWMWNTLPPMDRSVILQRLLDADWFGWRPMQCLLGPATWSGEVGRETLWIPRRIIDKPAHHFRWTAEPERRLVFTLKGGGLRNVVPTPIARAVMRLF